MEVKNSSLPEEIKNSLYVHDITDQNVYIYANLLSKIPRKSGFFRHASDGKNLAFVEKIKKDIESNPGKEKEPIDHRRYLEKNAQKRLIPLSCDESGNLSELVFANTPTGEIKYSSLQKCAEDQKAVLNLVQNIQLTPENKEKALKGNINAADAIAKINKENLFNHDDFYHTYINKSDKTQFSPISGIDKVTKDDNNFFLLSFEDNTIALISTKQLIAALFYTPVLQETESDDIEMASQIIPVKKNATKISNVLPQTFHGTQGTKHKAETDPNPKPQKRLKTEEDKTIEKTAEANDSNGIGEPILEDSHSLAF